MGRCFLALQIIDNKHFKYPYCCTVHIVESLYQPTDAFIQGHRKRWTGFETAIT